MSERWKYQIKTGAPWGIFMIAITSFFALKEKAFMIQIADTNFYFRAVGYILFGIFVLGYSSWKTKTRKINKP
jgi:hypothetical protein